MANQTSLKEMIKILEQIDQDTLNDMAENIDDVIPRIAD